MSKSFQESVIVHHNLFEILAAVDDRKEAEKQEFFRMMLSLIWLQLTMMTQCLSLADLLLPDVHPYAAWTVKMNDVIWNFQSLSPRWCLPWLPFERNGSYPMSKPVTGRVLKTYCSWTLSEAVSWNFVWSHAPFSSIMFELQVRKLVAHIVQVCCHLNRLSQWFIRGPKVLDEWYGLQTYHNALDLVREIIYFVRKLI